MLYLSRSQCTGYLFTVVVTVTGRKKLIAKSEYHFKIPHEIGDRISDFYIIESPVSSKYHLNGTRDCITKMTRRLNDI